MYTKTLSGIHLKLIWTEISNTKILHFENHDLSLETKFEKNLLQEDFWRKERGESSYQVQNDDEVWPLHVTDNDLMILGMFSGEVQILSINDNLREIFLKKFHNNWIYSIDSDLDRVALGSWDKKVTIFSLNSPGQVIKTFKFESSILQVKLSNKFLVCSSRKALHVFHLDKQIWEIPFENNFYSSYQSFNLRENLLTFVDGNKVKQFRISENAVEFLSEMEMEKDLWSICEKSDNTFYLAYKDFNFLLLVDLEEKKILKKIKLPKKCQVHEIDILNSLIFLSIYSYPNHEIFSIDEDSGISQISTQSDSFSYFFRLFVSNKFNSLFFFENSKKLKILSEEEIRKLPKIN